MKSNNYTVIYLVVIREVGVGKGIPVQGAKALSVTLSGGVLFAS